MEDLLGLQQLYTFIEILTVSGSTFLIKTLLDWYFNRIVDTPSFCKNYNLAIKVLLMMNQCSAWEDFAKKKLLQIH